MIVRADSDEDGGGDPAFKAAGLEEIIKDYNATYGQKFDLGTHAIFKKVLAARLAHKAPYIRIAGAEPFAAGPSEATARMAAEQAIWAKVAR